MGERRDYEATRNQKLLMATRGRTVGTRNEIIASARARGVFDPLAEVTSARPPFAVDPEDDPEFDYHPDEENNDHGEVYVDPELPDWQQRDLDEDPLENDPDDEDEDAN